MVEHQPSKLDTWVRFPSPAFYYARKLYDPFRMKRSHSCHNCKLTLCSACHRAGRMAIHTVKVEDFHSKLTSCATCRLAGRMAIHAVKVEDFHSKLTSCSACRRAGRMAIHAVKVEDFHSKLTSCSTCRRAGRMAIHIMKVEDFHSKGRGDHMPPRPLFYSITFHADSCFACARYASTSCRSLSHAPSFSA